MRALSARFTSKCHECGQLVQKDSEAIYDDDTKWIFHPHCAPEESGKTGAFSSKTDGYRKPERTPEQLADDLGFTRNGDLK